MGDAARADKLLAGLAGSENGGAGANARFLIGQAHVEQGRYAEALEPLKDYLAANPRGDVADYALADLAIAQLGLGRQGEAWDTLAQLASRFPSSKALPPSRLRLAEAALDAGQADRAIAQFRLVLGLDPSGKEDADRAKVSESAVTAVEAPIRLRALAGLGRALWKLGKPADAADVFGRFLDSSAGDPMAPQVALDRAASLVAAKQDRRRAGGLRAGRRPISEDRPGLACPARPCPPAGQDRPSRRGRDGFHEAAFRPGTPHPARRRGRDAGWPARGARLGPFGLAAA